MARKLEEDLNVSAEPKSAKSRSKKDPSRVSMPTVAMYALLTVVLMGGGLYAFHVTERFLIEDARFALEGSEDTVSLSVAGASNASVKAIQAVFQDDLGKSVYLLPLNDRRKGLRKVDWVRDATVARLWPNRLMVRVWERTPVAFVPMIGAGYGLIDAEGVLQIGRAHV